MLENETCYKTGHVSTRDFTVNLHKQFIVVLFCLSWPDLSCKCVTEDKNTTIFNENDGLSCCKTTTEECIGGVCDCKTIHLQKIKIPISGH